MHGGGNRGSVEQSLQTAPELAPYASREAAIGMQHAKLFAAGIRGNLKHGRVRHALNHTEATALISGGEMREG